MHAKNHYPGLGSLQAAELGERLGGSGCRSPKNGVAVRVPGARQGDGRRQVSWRIALDSLSDEEVECTLAISQRRLSTSQTEPSRVSSSRSASMSFGARRIPDGAVRGRPGPTGLQQHWIPPRL